MNKFRKYCVMLLIVSIFSLVCGISVKAQNGANYEGTGTKNLSNAVVLSSGFEDEDDNSLWVLENGSQENKWYIGSAASYSGSKSLYISNDGGVSNEYSTSSTSYVYAYRTLSIPAGECVVSFDWKSNGESSWDVMHAFLVPSSVTLTAGDANGQMNSTNVTPAGWYDVSSGIKYGQTQWQHNVTTVTVDAGTYNLVFFWKNDNSMGGQPPAAIDNVRVVLTDCQMISSLSVDEIGSDYASVSWSESGSASQWQYFLSNVSYDENELDTVPVTLVSSNILNLQNLEAGRTYYLYVRSYCSVTSQSVWTSVVINTSCGVAQIPIVESFESVGPPATCWKLIYGNNSPSVNPMIHDLEESSVGSRSFRFSSFSYYSSGNYNQYLVSPNISSGHHLILDFDYKNKEVDDTLYVGYSTTGDTPECFNWTKLSPSTFDFTSYTYILPGEATYFAFRYNANCRYYAWVDNVNMHEIECDVEGLSVTNVSSFSASFSWNEGSVSQWGIVVSESEMTAAQLENAAPVLVDENYYTATGLQEETEYHVYVRPYLMGSSSCDWQSITFTTETFVCSAVENLRIADAGNGVPVVAWDAVDSSDEWAVVVSATPLSNFSSVVPDIVETASYTVSSLGAINGSCYIYVRPTCNMSDASLWRSVRYSHNVDEIYECDFEDNSEITHWEIVNGDCENQWYIGDVANNGGQNGLYISNDGGVTNQYSITGTSQVYAYRQVNLPADDILVKFDWKAYGETGYDYLSVYLVRAIGDFSASNITSSAIIISSALNAKSSWSTESNAVHVDEAGAYYLVFKWTNDYSAGYQTPAAVDNISIVKPYCMASFDVDVDSNVLSMNLTWRNVNASDFNYQVFASTTSDADYQTVVPENISSPYYSISNLQPGTHYYIFYRKVCGEGEYSEWKTVSGWTESCYSPDYVDVEDVTVSTARCSWYASEYISRWEVLVSTSSSAYDATESPILVENSEFNVTGLLPETDYYVYVRSYCSEEYQGYWVSSQFTTLPTCMPVSGVEFSNITRTSVDLTWSAGGDETQWQVIVTESGSPDSELEHAIIVTGRPETAVSGLTSNTRYNAYVRAYCDADDQSSWVNTTLKTQCDLVELPIYESFESPAPPADCWSIVYASGNSQINQMIHDSYNSSEGSQSFRFSSFISVSDYTQYLISPEFSITQQTVLSFDYYTYGSGDHLWYGYSSTNDNVDSFVWTELPFNYGFENFRLLLPLSAKYIGFKYYGDCAYFAYVDNVKIENVSCAPVANANVDNVEAYQATVRWTDLVTSEYHEVLVSETNDPELATEQPYVVIGDSVNVTGLLPETEYYAFVRTYCGPDDRSSWINAGNFVTPPSCLPVSGLMIGEVANTWVEVSWTSTGVATQWQVLATVSDNVEDATEDMIIVSSTNVVVSGLMPDTFYYIFVRAYCSDDDQSSWIYGGAYTEPACMYTDNLRVVECEPDNAVVGWEQRYGPTQWQVVVLNGDTDINSVDENDMILVSTNSYTMSNLTIGEEYYIYVRAYCSETEKSDWRVVSFTTPQYPSMQMENYTQDFESGSAENWSVNAEGVNHWHIGTATNNGGRYGMYITSYIDGSTHEYDLHEDSYAFAYCRLRTGIDGIAVVDFDAKCKGENNYDMLGVFLVPEVENPQLSGPFDSYSSLYGEHHLTNVVNLDEWQHWHFEKQVSTGIYDLIFAWRNDNSYGEQPPAAFDNISVNFHQISDENDILSFDFNGAQEIIIDADAHTVECEVLYNASLQITPEIVVSEYATISPESGVPQDFTNPVVYTVISESGIAQAWTVTVTKLPASSMAEIVSFDFDGKLSSQINSTMATINATISRAFDITSIRPTIEVSPRATVFPESGVAVDFSDVAYYYVTAENGSRKPWAVSISYADSPEGADCANPIVVDAETELPYLDIASTEGKYNMYNSFFADVVSAMVNTPGEDVVYRLDVADRSMVSIHATSSSELSLLLTSACGTARADMIDARLKTMSASIDNKDLRPGSYYIIIDSRNGSIDYELQITRANYCFDVDNLHVVERLQNSITVEWTQGANETSWNVDYALAGQTPNGANSSTATSTSYTITGLTENTDYIIKVSALCGAASTSDGVLIDASTISSCQKPDDIVVDNVMNDGISLSWNGFNMMQWTVEYKSESDDEYESVTVSENSVSITDLSSSTMYDIRIKSVCGDGIYSDYAYISCYTSCDYISEFPFVENFDGETFPPDCWKQERTATGSGPGISYMSGAWKRSTSQVCDNTTPKVQLADTKAGAVNNLVSQPFFFSETLNGYEIRLDVYRSTASSSASDEGIEVWVNSLPNITVGTPQRLGFVSKNYTISDGGIVGAEESAGCYTYIFNTMRTGVTYVILVGKSQYAGGVYADNLVVDKADDCIAASNLSVAEVGINDVTLTWNNRNNSCVWNVEYSVDGGEYQSVELSESELLVEGLTSESLHDISVRIQAICVADVAESQWYEDSLTFVTNCDINPLPYAQNFDEIDQLPYCWESYHWSGANNIEWTVADGQAYLPVSASSNTTLLISSRLRFTSDNDYLLDFDVYRTRQNVSNPDTLMVYYSSTKNLSTASLMGRVIMQNAQVNGMENIKLDFPALYGDYFVIFAAVGMRSFQIDNVTVRGLSSEADILSFSFAEQTSEAVIDAENKTVSIGVDFGTDLTSLVPTFTISPYATVDYQSGVARDFSSSVVYNVTSENALFVNSWTINAAIDENACPNPSDNDISLVVDGDSVSISISQIFNETSYNLKVASGQIDPDNEIADVFDGTITTGDTVIYGLYSHTEYHVYVQSNCGASGWTEKTFFTSCGVYELPYEEDFSASVDLNCWSVKDGNADGNTWNIANGYARYSFSRTQNADDYLVSPVFPIVNHTKFKFNYYVGNFSYPEKFSVYVISEGDTVLIASRTATNESTEQFGPIDISQYAGSDAQIAIRCYSEPYMYRLYIDDFSIKTSEFEILSSAVGRGTITPDGITDALSGDTITYEINPLNGNELVSLILDSRDVTSDVVDNVYQLANIRMPHTLTATFTDNFVISATSSEGGSISPSGDLVYRAGESVSFAFLPDEGYRISSVVVDGVDIISSMTSNTYSFENLADDHTISVSFSEIIYYTVEATAGEHGSVAPSGTITVEEGSELTLVADPDEGYRVAAFEIDGVDVIASNNTYTLQNIDADHTVNVTFEEIVFRTITASCGENGTITPAGDFVAYNGSNIDFVIVPNAGYHISTVLVDGVESSALLVDGVYSFRNVTSDHTIYAEFEINTYTISSYARGGTITPSGVVSVAHGESVTFEFAPDEEYELANVIVDNRTVEPEGNTYVFENVSANHTIAVVFTPMNIAHYNISATAGDHGSISPNGVVRVAEGGSQQFDITPDAHYYISSILVDGSQVETAESYVFDNVVSDHSIAVGFAAYQHIITASAGIHGAISPSGEVLVDEGSDATFTFIPDRGYRVALVTVDGDPVDFENDSYTIEDVMVDHNIDVSFEIIPVWTITAASSNNGTISPSGAQYVVDGESITFSFVPDEGYVVERFVVDGQSHFTSETSYTFENVTEDHYIYVAFRTFVYYITATAGEHGQIEPAGIVEVLPGDNQLFSFIPDMGYRVDSVFVDGAPVVFENDQYLFENVDSMHSIHVTFVHIEVSSEEIEVNNISLYPNPNDGVFSIAFADMNGHIVCQLIDVRGALLDEREAYVEDGSTIEMSYDLNPGTYFVKIISDDKVVVERFVVR